MEHVFRCCVYLCGLQHDRRATPPKLFPIRRKNVSGDQWKPIRILARAFARCSAGMHEMSNASRNPRTCDFSVSSTTQLQLWCSREDVTYRKRTTRTDTRKSEPIKSAARRRSKRTCRARRAHDIIKVARKFDLSSPKNWPNRLRLVSIRDEFIKL